MKIKRVISQHRRDFKAIYICDNGGCGYDHEGVGYDDENFHQNVIPNMVCGRCGKKSPKDHRPLAPLHPEGRTV